MHIYTPQMPVPMHNHPSTQLHMHPPSTNTHTHVGAAPQCMGNTLQWTVQWVLDQNAGEPILVEGELSQEEGKGESVNRLAKHKCTPSK